MLGAERIKRCTVHGARTSKDPINQLTSSLRSRRKLRLGGPGNGQKPVSVRSPWQPAGQNERVGRLHFTKNWTIAGSRHAPNSRHPRTVFTSKSLLQARNRAFLRATVRRNSAGKLGRSLARVRPASSRSNPSSKAFQAGRCFLHRNHKGTAFPRPRSVSRRGFGFVLRFLPSPKAEPREK